SVRSHVAAARRLRDFVRVDVIDADELIALECDVLVPAALGGMIHAENAHLIKARAVIEGANSPTTPTADDIINDAGVLGVPDVLANAGGVVVSYYEWVQNLQHFRWDEREVNDKLGTTMRRAHREAATRGEARRCGPRTARGRPAQSTTPCRCASRPSSSGSSWSSPLRGHAATSRSRGRP